MPKPHFRRMPPAAKKRFEDRPEKRFTGEILEVEAWNKHTIVSKILCYGGCGTPMNSLIPNADLGMKQRRIEGTETVIQTVYMVLAQSDQYDMVELAMSDGSIHQMPLCKVCKLNLKHEDLESLYAAGLEAFAVEDEQKNIPKEVTIRFLNTMAHKEVKAIVARGFG